MLSLILFIILICVNIYIFRILGVLENPYEAMIWNKVILAVILDFSKAFDTVDLVTEAYDYSVPIIGVIVEHSLEKNTTWKNIIFVCLHALLIFKFNSNSKHISGKKKVENNK